MDEQDEPVTINAIGPHDVAEPVVETRHYENNVDAYDDKAAESLKAQTAPNPTTDLDEARKAYGEDWNRRRKGKVIGETEGGEKVYAIRPGITEADRYPVTAEAAQRAEQENYRSESN